MFDWKFIFIHQIYLDLKNPALDGQGLNEFLNSKN